MNDAAAIEAPPTARHWGTVGTVAWGIAIALAFIGIQSIAMIAYLARGKAGLTEEGLRALADAAQANGVVISLATLLTATLCVPLILVIAKLKRGSRLGDYMAAKAIPGATLARWLGLTALVSIASDMLTWVLGKPLVPEFMRSVYASADPPWLLWIALVGALHCSRKSSFAGSSSKGCKPPSHR